MGGFAVIAPIDGTLVSTAVKVGDVISSGAPMSTIVPSRTALVAELDVPPSAVGFVQPGNQAKVMFDAYSYERFGFGSGVVRSISGAPMQPLVVDPTKPAVPVYRVVLQLNENYLDAYGRSWSLVPGMTLSADLVTERQSFLRRLIDPVRATFARM